MATVHQSEDPNLAIPRRLHTSMISNTNLWRILRKGLDLRAYEIVSVQDLKSSGHL